MSSAAKWRSAAAAAMVQRERFYGRGGKTFSILNGGGKVPDTTVKRYTTHGVDNLYYLDC